MYFIRSITDFIFLVAIIVGAAIYGSMKYVEWHNESTVRLWNNAVACLVNHDVLRHRVCEEENSTEDIEGIRDDIAEIHENIDDIKDDLREIKDYVRDELEILEQNNEHHRSLSDGFAILGQNNEHKDGI